MKKVAGILLAVLVIGTMPAFAAEYSGITVDTMAVRGKGTAESVVQILENGSTSTVAGFNTTETLNTSTKLDTAGNNNSVASINNQTTVTESTKDLNDSLVNVTIPQSLVNNSTKNTTGIVMQSTNYSCGPAALATVLNNLGINTTEQELKVLAGTDTSGTSMYGLVHAAQSKGLNLVGSSLSIDDLSPNTIVILTKNGTPHFSVVREVTNESVKLADPSLGNIEMSIERFNEIYSGYALYAHGGHVVVTQPSVNYTTTRVSVATNGTESGGYSSYIAFISGGPSISSDGRYIAFTSFATNLVANDTNTFSDVFVRDRLLNTTTLVSVSSAGVQGNASSKSPSISADGRYVAFISYATNLVANDTFNNVFVRDLLLNTTTLVSVNTTTLVSVLNSSDVVNRIGEVDFMANARVGSMVNAQPSISADGCYIAFSASYSIVYKRLITHHTNIIVYDRISKTTEKISVYPFSQSPSTHSPSISADGRYVAFTSSIFTI
jgi:predicted double-glycine peptidase